MLKPLVCCLALSLQASTPDEGRAIGPKLGEHDLSVEFDTVTAGSPVSVWVDLPNNSDRPLRILDHKSSCGCISLAEGPKVIAPKQSGRFAIKLNTTGLRGRVIQSVILKTDRAVIPLSRLELRGLVRAVWLEPTSIDFGTISGDETPVRHVLVMAAGLPDARIDSIRLADSEAISTTIKKADVREIHRMMNINSIGLVELRWTGRHSSIGDYATELVVATNIEAARVLRVPITAHVSGASKLDPPKLIFGSVGDGQTVLRTCSVEVGSRWDEATGRRISFEGGHPAVKARLEGIDSKTGRCKVEVIVDGKTSRGAGTSTGLIRGKVDARLGDRVIFSIPYIFLIGDGRPAAEDRGRAGG